ncbi:MAG TPA: hypothetical protein PK668_05730 [Myxococcota bacterium]|nr:hypothetical protein [Myxococcota bacterium]HRY92660.1 hypothetical protein [Myxococcota bacterium]HSA24526.1 hypothetical protein [Myxococcota bacterium]
MPDEALQTSRRRWRATKAGLLGALLGTLFGLGAAWLTTVPRASPLRRAASEACRPAAKAAPAQPAGESAPGKPADVRVGMYVVNLYSLSIRDNSFKADVWVWFHWSDPELKPTETFEIPGARIAAKECSEHGLRDGLQYASCKLSIEATQSFDVGAFPFDDQAIHIQLEDKDSEAHRLRYVADVANCSMDSNIVVPGWKLGGTEATVDEHRYCSNFGDLSLPTGSESVYSRFNYSMEFRRAGVTYFLKLLIALFVATAIALLALWIRPTDLDPRFGLGAAALFASVANEYVISGHLPNSDVISTADALHMVSMVVILLTLVESTISLALFYKGREETSRLLDRCSFGTLTALFVSVCLWVSLLA